MISPEILSPAGSEESLRAALYCGANAVYAGCTRFSARQRAENFTLENLPGAVALTHLFGAKFYLTINTLVRDDEMTELMRVIETAVRSGVDALIVQDIGVMRVCQKCAPEMPLHASTQMTIHTKAGLYWAKNHGLQRVILARELKKCEIEALCRYAREIQIETEVFVHGAQCMSVSGQCELSAMIGGRSANRGCCAGSCRLPFSAAGPPGDTCYALSLKDLSRLPEIQRLAETGVTSLKIEGRLKRPEYVAATTTACREALAGKKPDMETLRRVFSRDGFCCGYDTKPESEMFGVRQKDDIVAAREILPKFAALSQNMPAIVSIQIHVVAKIGAPVTAEVTDSEGNVARVQGENVTVASRNPITTEMVQQSFEKCGGTIYRMERFSAEIDPGAFLSRSACNSCRRELLAQLDAARIARNQPKIEFHPMEIERPQKGSRPGKKHSMPVQVSAWSGEIEKILSRENVEIVLPVEAVGAVPVQYADRAILTAGRFCPDEAKLYASLKKAALRGFHKFQCDNLAHIPLGKSLGFTLYGGLGLNVSNCYAIEFLREENLVQVVVSPELTFRQMRALSGLPLCCYGYGKIPVMIQRVCPIRAEIGCGQCRHQLTDRTGRKFPVYCKGNGVITMYNADTLWLADQLTEIPTDVILLDCRLTPPAEIGKIPDAYETGAAAPENISMTRGLYFRGTADTEKGVNL